MIKLARSATISSIKRKENSFWTVLLMYSAVRRPWSKLSKKNYIWKALLQEEQQHWKISEL